MVSRLSEEEIDAIELNVSCPNVKTGCLSFGSNEKELRILLREVRKNCKKPLFIKLTPNVSDIALMAKVCEDEGADAVSLINTILALAIDITTRMPILKNNFGGLSGPCIKPIALRMVRQVYNAVSIPIIGMGGITNHIDVLEFMMAGSTACMVGTANFSDVSTTETIIEGLKAYMKENMIEDICSITGSLKFH
jgi:dihydroorotate dehydrogenase (NAD+) catalytic subunit